MTRTLMTSTRKTRCAFGLISAAVLVSLGCTPSAEEPTPSTGTSVIEIIDFEDGRDIGQEESESQ